MLRICRRNQQGVWIDCGDPWKPFHNEQQQSWFGWGSLEEHPLLHPPDPSLASPAPSSTYSIPLRSLLFPNLKKPCLLHASKCLIAFAFNFTERKTALLATFGVVLCKTELILCFLLNLKSKNIKYDVIATHSHISMYIIYRER